MNKVYGVVLAGGIGSRMGNVSMPKQFLKIGDKPTIIHTIEKFMMVEDCEKIIVSVTKNWVDYTKTLVEEYLGKTERIVVIQGGADRNGSLMNAIDHIENVEGEDDSIIVTHDAVRPFIDIETIKENIRIAKTGVSVDTVIPAVDTIVEFNEKDEITNIPVRDFMGMGQTPQTFNAKKLKENYNNLSEEQKSVLSDACKIMIAAGDTVVCTEGSPFNFKITTKKDLQYANILIGRDDVK